MLVSSKCRAAEGQDEAHFSLNRQIIHFKSKGDKSHTKAALVVLGNKTPALMT